MSERFPGGFITNNPTAPTTTSAPGIWTLDQATQYIKAGTWPYGGPFNYIEDVFSTYLYTGTGGTQSIPSGIDYTKGFLYWAKTRDSGASSNNHYLVDSERGANSILISNTTGAALAPGNQWTALTTTSITVQDFLNLNGRSEVGWTFRKQPKFFDVVTYTGDGVAGRTISHNLGSVPGCIIVKRLDLGRQWAVYHKSIGNQFYLVLNNTSAKDSSVNQWNNTDPTSTVFTVSAGIDVNSSGGTYVAYVFADNAGGFGLTGTDNVISCGSFTTDGFGSATVSLGYEPQWVMCKASSGLSDWFIFDNMRGWAYGDSYYLRANSTPADTNTGSNTTYPTATGFQVNNVAFDSSKTYIYIAIRRGPMKTPTSGTSVFKPFRQNDSVVATTGWPVDMFIDKDAPNGGASYNGARLIGGAYLQMSATSAEVGFSPIQIGFQNNTGVTPALVYNPAESIYAFQRAPGFFDVVCYTGNNTNNRTINHNLGVAPEMMIVKARTNTGFAAGNDWNVVNFGIKGTYYSEGILNSTASMDTTGVRLNVSVAPTTTTVAITGPDFSYGNYSPNTYVCYLFASCPGVSKIGSYTGNGGTQTINCGFTGGARFVLIKRIDASGDWYVYDTARGMTTLTDPYLLLNSTAAESATLGSVTTVSTGFALNASILAAINTNGASYFFLAIA